MNKYHAKRTEVDGIIFASKREAKRYQELKLLERAREIKDLKLQQRYPLKINGVLICTYVADFVYQERQNVIVEDCKGVKTRVYQIKKKLMLAILSIPIRET